MRNFTVGKFDVVNQSQVRESLRLGLTFNVSILSLLNIRAVATYKRVGAWQYAAARNLKENYHVPCRQNSLQSLTEENPT